MMQKEFQVSQYKLVFTFSLINYLKEVLVLDGVSVRWYMQTKFSRYYIFPYNVVYLLSFRLSPLNVCTSFLTNNFVSHNPAFKWRNAFSFLLLICGWPINLMTNEIFLNMKVTVFVSKKTIDYRFLYFK